MFPTVHFIDIKYREIFTTNLYLGMILQITFHRETTLNLKLKSLYLF